MKLMRNPGGVVAWHSDAEVVEYMKPLPDGRTTDWEILLSCDSEEEVPAELQEQAAALIRGDAVSTTPAPSLPVETPVDLSTGEPKGKGKVRK